MLGLQRCDGCFSNGSDVGAGNVRRTGGAATGRRWHSARGSGAVGPGRRVDSRGLVLRRVAERWPGAASRRRVARSPAGANSCKALRPVCGAHRCVSEQAKVLFERALPRHSAKTTAAAATASTQKC